MRLVCPSCGAIASLDAWERDGQARELVRCVSAMPAPMASALLGYLALFRPGKRMLSWKKALRVCRELAALAETGHVQVRGRVARPCPARIWAAAMEQMVERRGSLSLPLKNHNYLRQVAYQMADTEDAQREQVTRQNEAAGNHRPVSGTGDDELSPLMRRYIEKHGDPLQRMEGGADGK